MLDKVLLIDDDETTLILSEFIMERYQFAREVYRCMNGREGIDFFEHYHEMKEQGIKEKLPDLIFLDLNMPVMNGWDFLEDMYKHFPDEVSKTNVVILSSTVDHKDLERSVKYDVVADFISKPLNQASLSRLRNNNKLQSIFQENSAPKEIL